jgi:uncharacterized protein
VGKLSGQRALVTGASSGIGKEIAKVLAEHGANLVLTARRKERLEDLAKQLRDAHGIEARVVTSDLTDPGAAARLFEETEGAGLAVDILVNNAGFGSWESFLDVPWDVYQRVIQVNMTALTELTFRFLPGMRERGHGHVMNVASMGAYLPCPNFAVYAATKAYVRNLTEAVDYEVKSSGVRCIAVCPGGTKTEFLETANQDLKAGAELFMMSAERCARIAVKKMLRGRRTVVTGFMNVLSVLLLRWLPRCLMPWFADVTMGGAVEKGDRPPGGLPAPSPSPAEAPAPRAESAEPAGSDEAPPTPEPSPVEG